MKGKLFVIEGCDGSGKATQAEKIYGRLLSEKLNVMKIEFPNYKSESSSLVKMYLNGDFGGRPEDINPYAASTFYAADRYASYKMDWQGFYERDGIIIADRYTTANMVHQASKIKEEAEKERFLNWLWDFEFIKFKLPVPDCVIFLDMPPKYSRKLMEQRKNKFTGEMQKDIHENDYEYLIDSYRNSCFVAEKYNWHRIRCVEDNTIKTIEQIHEEVYNIIGSYI